MELALLSNSCTAGLLGVIFSVRRHASCTLLPQFNRGSALMGGMVGAVDTACSSSLVSAHLAVNAMHRQECSTAAAMGANLTLLSSWTRACSRASMLADDGRCGPPPMAICMVSDLQLIWKPWTHANRHEVCRAHYMLAEHVMGALFESLQLPRLCQLRFSMHGKSTAQLESSGTAS